MRSIVLKAVPLALSLWLAGAAQAQIKIGVAGPITGANAAFGAQLSQGVTQAAEDIRWQLGQADRFRAGLVRAGAWETVRRSALR